jgi:hypothetical protein
VVGSYSLSLCLYRKPITNTQFIIHRDDKYSTYILNWKHIGSEGGLVSMVNPEWICDIHPSVMHPSISYLGNVSVMDSTWP